MTKDTPILITGAGGFVGKNLSAQLKNLGYTALDLYDMDTPPDKLREYTARAGFIYHLAGVNRPKDPVEFYSGNQGTTEELLQLLEEAGNNCPVLLCSSVQAELDNDYGKSKRQAEELLFAHEQKTGAPALVYRLPGLFGKWCRPNYNSVVATFCHNAAHGLPLTVRDPAYAFTIAYIDDVVEDFIKALQAGAVRDMSIPGYCHLTCAYETTLGFLAKTIESFPESRTTLQVADLGDELTKKLYSTYLSYLPPEGGFKYALHMHSDARGSFTEFLRTPDRGQISVSITHPGIARGNHWHHTKNEKFLVVQGRGVIRFRKLGEKAVYEYFVSGEKLEVVDIPVGYTHNIENLGDSDLITLMWANEPFDAQRPDTFYEEV